MPQRVRWLELGVDIGMDNLRQYNDILESHLESSLVDFERRVEEQASEMDEEDRNEFYEFHSSEYWRLSDVFPTTLRSSLFVACYSLLEHELTSLCRYLYRKNAYSDEPNFWRGIIFEARDYSTNKACIEFPDVSESWQIIKCYYNPIRNVIVHQGGKIDDRRLRTLNPFIDANASVSLDSLGRVQLHRAFCPEVLSTLRQFFRELIEAVPDL